MRCRRRGNAALRALSIFARVPALFGTGRPHWKSCRADRQCYESGFKARVVPASPVIGVYVGSAVGIAYECAERINDKFTDAAPEVVIEA